MQNQVQNIKVMSPMSYTRVITDSKYDFGGHRHKSWEFKFVFQGSLEVTSDDSVVKLTPCDVMVIEPDVFHREITDNADYMVLQMELEGAVPTGKARVKQLDSPEIELVKLIKHYCEMYTAGKGKKGNKHGIKIDNAKADCTLAKLAEVMLFNILTDSTDGKVNADDRGAVLYNKAVNYMKKNLDRSISLGEISRQVGSCPTVLKSTFAKYTGHGLMHHFAYLRMTRAKEMLDEGQTAQEVAESLGFSSLSYFSQSFKRMCGCVPSRYKKTADTMSTDYDL